jgi:hypothetical protein
MQYARANKVTKWEDVHVNIVGAITEYLGLPKQKSLSSYQLDQINS